MVRERSFQRAVPWDSQEDSRNAKRLTWSGNIEITLREGLYYDARESFDWVTKLVRWGIDGYLGNGKARCKRNPPLASTSSSVSPRPPATPALAQRSMETNSPSLAFGHCTGEQKRKEKKTEGERGKNNLANFSTAYKGTGTTTARLKRHPTFRPFSRPSKGSKVHVQPLSRWNRRATRIYESTYFRSIRISFPYCF